MLSKKRPGKGLSLLLAAAVMLSGGLLTSSAASAAVPDPFEGHTVEQARQYILNKTNEYRKAAKLPALTMSSQMNTVSQNWNNTMAKQKKMYHNPSFTKQMPAGWSYAGENVASGYTLSAVTKGWFNSPGHKANMLNKNFNTIGIGVGKDSNGNTYFTQNFGKYAKVPSPVKPVNMTLKHNPSINKGEVIAIGADGKLWNYGKMNENHNPPRKQIGSGWQNFLSVHPVDWNGDGIMDIVGNNKDGKLYAYIGIKAGGFSSIVIGSTGWNKQDIAVGKWKKTDTLPSLFYSNSGGKLMAYGRSNTNKTHLGNATQIGSGWGGLEFVTLDTNADGAVDFVAKNKTTGDAILYPNTGAGKFGASVIQFKGQKTKKLAGLNHMQGNNTAALIMKDTSTGKLTYHSFTKNQALFGEKQIGSSGWKPYVVGGGWKN